MRYWAAGAQPPLRQRLALSELLRFDLSSGVSMTPAKDDIAHIEKFDNDTKISMPLNCKNDTAQIEKIEFDTKIDMPLNSKDDNAQIEKFETDPKISMPLNCMDDTVQIVKFDNGTKISMPLNSMDDTAQIEKFEFDKKISMPLHSKDDNAQIEKDTKISMPLSSKDDNAQGERHSAMLEVIGELQCSQARLETLQEQHQRLLSRKAVVVRICASVPSRGAPLAVGIEQELSVSCGVLEEFKAEHVKVLARVKALTGDG